MLQPVTFRVLALAACGWLLAGEACALTLGRARGAALIGRPLEISVPVMLDTAGGDSLCPRAELFYGDSRVAAPSVRWEPDGAGQGHVRVNSAAPVDEPMVTLYLHVGCAQVSTRRYVLLPELPPENEPAARAAATRAAAQAAQPVAPARAPAVQAPAPVAQSQASSAASATPRRRQAPAVATPRAPAVARAPVAAPAPRNRREQPQARLRLEPLDLGVERDPVLRFSPEITPQATDPQRRAALSALWQAMQRSPEQSVDDAVRLHGLERELGTLRESARQNTADVAQLKAQVQQAQGERRFANGLLLALAAVLAAVLGVLAWRWYRARQLEQVGRWFEAHGDSTQGAAPTSPVVPSTAPQSLPAPAVVPVAAAVPAPAPTPAPKRVPAVARGPASSWGTPEEFHASRGALRMVGVQELIDVHDKADFFLSIGETEQAIAALEAHVHDHVETGALAWMDLLELYHSLGRRAEFERLRAEFRQRFAAQVPDFDHFDKPSASLESYGRALSRIVELWPSRRALDVIEESIFRKPDRAGAESFSLEAYRELVLLHHIAKDLAGEEPVLRPPAPTGFGQTSLQPLNVLDRPLEPPLTERERLMIPPASARLGVDIDLDAAPAPATRELPDLDFDFSTFDPANTEDKGR